MHRGNRFCDMTITRLWRRLRSAEGSVGDLTEEPEFQLNSFTKVAPQVVGGRPREGARFAPSQFSRLQRIRRHLRNGRRRFFVLRCSKAVVAHPTFTFGNRAPLCHSDFRTAAPGYFLAPTGPVYVKQLAAADRLHSHRMKLVTGPFHFFLWPNTFLSRSIYLFLRLSASGPVGFRPGP